MTAKSRVAKIRLRKNLVRSVKRGHAWLYSDATDVPTELAGGHAYLYAKEKETPIASGIIDPTHPIPFRVCRTQAPWELGDEWLAERLDAALSLREQFIAKDTNGFRLIAGEGDGLPGMIVDRYGDVAVMKFDGEGVTDFYQPKRVIRWLQTKAEVRGVVMRSRQRGRAGEVAWGHLQQNPVWFKENGLRFTADVIHGQKTGFFLDQRDNRQLVRTFCSGRRVLNLFSFNGGFSVAAGVGGASSVTSVDIAVSAIEGAELAWEANGLEPTRHKGIAQDCFEFLQNAITTNQTWDIVICDPPSFAPNEKSKDNALAAYRKLSQMAARITRPTGLLALASCSSHINAEEFRAINLEGIGTSRRKATQLAERGLPPDHPTPAAMPELRYLKFQLFQLD